MISLQLARSLRDAGLMWSPTPGDRFVVADRGMDEQVFVLSDMTVEVRSFPTGPVIAFNGTTEWALDSVDQGDVLWLPAEHQLRELLGPAFRALERTAEGFIVALEVTDTGAQQTPTPGDTAAGAYGRALLAVLLRTPVTP